MLAVLAIAALMAGCGSDNASENGAIDTSSITEIDTSSITKTEFVRKAIAICAPGDTRLAKAVAAYQGKHLNEPSTNTVSGAGRAVIKPILLAQVARIRNLGAPHGDAAEIERFFTTLLSGADEIITGKAETFREAQSMLEPAAAITHRYGIDRCAFSILGYLEEGGS